MGLIKRTPKGRMAMPAAWAHLGLKIPPGLENFFVDADGDRPSGNRTLFDSEEFL
jgi:hypothetical protein